MFSLANRNKVISSFLKATKIKILIFLSFNFGANCPINHFFNFFSEKTLIYQGFDQNQESEVVQPVQSRDS